MRFGVGGCHDLCLCFSISCVLFWCVHDIPQSPSMPLITKGLQGQGITRTICVHKLALDCLVIGCREQVVDTDEKVSVALLRAHISTHTVDTGCNQLGELSELSEIGKLARPKVTQGMSMDSWRSFQVLWRLYKDVADLSEAECGLQLIFCCNEELIVQLLSVDPNVLAKPEIEQLDSIRRLAIAPDAMGVRRSKVLSVPQEVGERPRVLYKKEQGKKAACEPKCAKKRCREKEESDGLTDMTIKYVLVNGLAEAETRSEVLDRNLLEDNSLAETVAFIEQKETTRDALKGGDEDESVNPVETPRDVLGWDLLDESFWADAVTPTEQKETETNTKY